MMDILNFDYELPENSIAQTPVEPRDHSRLLVANREKQSIEHKYFFDIVDYLNPGDILVVNDTKVIAARLNGEKSVTGGKVEILLTKKMDVKYSNEWEAMVRPSKRIPEGTKIIFPDTEGFYLTVEESLSEGLRRVVLSSDFLITKAGDMPFPPYIKDRTTAPERYQTVYATEPGSVASPTAGLHFTESLFNKIRQKGVFIEKVTLHIGSGTFRPVTHLDVKRHEMSTEMYSVKDSTVSRIKEAKLKGKKIVCVGTTSVRSLESLALKQNVEDHLSIEKMVGGRDETKLYILPGFEFKITDMLITNFHLPKSTLLMLVHAFAGSEFTRDIYDDAIKHDYRFYSFGDAMIII
jgi:S-adenosylmethionine:tRNA ribosyltransferase-isomerase